MSFITNKSHFLFSPRLCGLKKFILVFVAKMVDGVKFHLSAQSRQNSLKSTIETKKSMNKQEMTLICNKKRRETFLLSHTCINLYPEKDVYCAVYVYSIHIHVHVHQIHESDVYLCRGFT